MKIVIKDVIEQLDGSAMCDIECDAEFTKAAIQHYFEFLIMAALDEENDEYQIVKEKALESSEPKSTRDNRKKVPTGKRRNKVGGTGCSCRDGSRGETGLGGNVL
jgi:hypothetical protein